MLFMLLINRKKIENRIDLIKKIFFQTITNNVAKF
jgi:hypothetical protein